MNSATLPSGGVWYWLGKEIIFSDFRISANKER
jgi:hypothetical protein